MKKTEICLHCGGDYIPKRRGVQKFCSNSCRSGHWLLKQPNKNLPLKGVLSNNELPEAQKNTKRTENISLVGIGNAAIGTAVVELGKKLLISQDNKPATKKDIEDLKALISERYLPITNMLPDNFNRKPYYDFDQQIVVYLYNHS